MSYMPNIAIHPGKVLERIILQANMTQKELSLRMGLTEKHISQIINGEASVTTETAVLFELVLGGSSKFWLNLEADYKEAKYRILRQSLLKKEITLLKNFPYKELEKRGYFEKTEKDEQKVEYLQKFFSVSSLLTIEKIEKVAFRKRQENEIKNGFIAAWLRCGELEAKKVDLPEFNEQLLKDNIIKIRELIPDNELNYLSKIRDLLNEAGVSVVFIKHFQGTKINGAVRWIGNNPSIQLSFFNPWIDIFVFTLFHEIGHILLHGKKEKFIEIEDYNAFIDYNKENEANKFATNFLIKEKEFAKFVVNKDFTIENIIAFANAQKIDPSIVAGRLCHESLVTWAFVSSLRKRFNKDVTNEFCKVTI
ncbi:MAG TPA: HigA family addiction module antitoxin [Melioribacteraceae bacterium]|nr:HigA family addiction module antitoxin [Melioribacteraceae bacterium]